MSHDPEELKHRREHYADLSTETLLRHAAEEAGEFTAEALELIEQELTRRGVSRGEIDERRRRALAGAAPESHERGTLTAVAHFGERLFAVQARDLLERNDIAALLHAWGGAGDREFPAPDVEASHTLMVAQADVPAALRVLEGFAPAAGEEGAVFLLADEADEGGDAAE